MGSPEKFEAAFKEAVCAKRLSGSKVTQLTDLAMGLMKDDTQLVASLYRMHKVLPASAKVSSLYAMDALARAARSRATKKKLTGDMTTVPGNCATFLLKLDGILDGVFQDVVTSAGSEGKEKSKKVLDIWTKANTFSSSVLKRLSDVLKATSEGTGDKASGSTSSATPAAIRPPSLAPATTPPIPAPVQASTAPTAVDPALQATLLALLTQVSNSNGAPPPGQTSTNSGPPVPHPASAQHGHAPNQHTLLQQLTQSTNVAQPFPFSHVPQQPAFGPSHSSPTPPTFQGQHNPSGNRADYADPRRNVPGSPSYGHTARSNYSDQYGENHSYPVDRDRGGFRGRGRGGNWQEDRNRFQRGRPREDLDRSRVRSSRSRSPRSSYSSGRRRDVKLYSPPHRPTLAALEVSPVEPPSSNSVGKDEFGRDIRPSDESPPPTVKASTKGSPRSPRRTTAPRSTQSDGDQPEASTSTSNSSSSTMSVPPRAAPGAVGLESFDILNCDFSAPASWEALGKAWEVTHGVLPSQEELMTFVMSATAMANQAAMMYGGWMGQADWVGGGGDYNLGMGDTAMGVRGNGFASQGGGYGNGNVRNHEQWGHAKGGNPYEVAVDSSVQDGNGAVSEGGGGGEQVGSKGSMQRVEGKWKFVRADAS